MPRPTKEDIVSKMLAGDAIDWKEGKKKLQIKLSTPEQRRLFEFLLKGNVREPKGLSVEFVNGLAVAYQGTADPATDGSSRTDKENFTGPWRLHAVKAEQFGGLSISSGPSFEVNFECESYLVEGQNGSGKSSLLGAILWALTGERHRDQSNSRAEELKPVYDSQEKAVGNWPPIACYP